MTQNSSQTPKPTQRGFTLVELMVVITVMVMINAIIASAVMSYLTESREAQAKAKMVILAADLDSQWRFKQTFAGYRHSTVTVPVKNFLFQYTITILDKDVGVALTSPSAIGKHYAIIAKPTAGADSPSYYIDDMGIICMNESASLVTKDGCGTSGVATW